MKRNIYIIFVICMCCILLGCGYAQYKINTKAQNTKIKVGMTKDEVENIFLLFGPHKSDQYVKTLTNSSEDVILVKWYRINWYHSDYTPYIFKDNVLVGWGNNALNAQLVGLTKEEAEGILMIGAVSRVETLTNSSEEIVLVKWYKINTHLGLTGKWNNERIKETPYLFKESKD